MAFIFYQPVPSLRHVVLSQPQTGLYSGAIKWSNHCSSQSLITGLLPVLQKSSGFMTKFSETSPWTKVMSLTSKILLASLTEVCGRSVILGKAQNE